MAHILNNVATEILTHLSTTLNTAPETIEPHRNYVISMLEEAPDARTISNKLLQLEDKGLQFPEIEPNDVNWMMPFVSALSQRDRLVGKPETDKSSFLGR